MSLLLLFAGAGTQIPAVAATADVIVRVRPDDIVVKIGPDDAVVMIPPDDEKVIL